MDSTIEKYNPNNEIVNVLLTDCYQLMMIYAHWKNDRHNIRSVFDLYFRKSPFNLEFSIMGGIDECFDFIKGFKFTERHIEYLKDNFKEFDKEFFHYLSKLDLSNVNIYGVENGSIVTPNTPLLTLEGPVNEIQLIETTLINLTNYPTLIASLAYKLRLLYPNKILIEDGSQYGQSPNGSLSGCKYSYIGTVNSTTSLLASRIYNLDLHTNYADVEEDLNNFTELFDIPDAFMLNNLNLLEEANKLLSKYKNLTTSSLFKSRLLQAVLLPNNFTVKITNKITTEKMPTDSNIIDFLIISFLLQNSNYTNQTLFLDFEDSYLITENLRQIISFPENVKFLIAVRYSSKMLKPVKGDFDIIVLGPEFLTCETKTALGMVYKLMDFNNSPCIKFSEEKEKRTIPGFKKTVRFYNESSNIICDYLLLNEEFDVFISSNAKIIKGYFPYDETKEAIDVKFSHYQVITNMLFEKGRVIYKEKSAKELRENLLNNLTLAKNSTKISLYVSKGIIDIIRRELDRNN